MSVLLGASLSSLRAQTEAPPVVFVQLDEASAQIFDRWPAGALDYAVLMHHLAGLRPAVVAMADVVSWPDLQPPHQRILASKLETMTVVWGAGLDGDPVEKTPAESWQPWLSLTAAREGAGREFALCPGVTAMPHPSLWDSGKIGFIQLDFGPRIEFTDALFEIPVAARAGEDRLVAGFPLAALAEARGWDAAHLVVDSEAGAILGPDGFRVPIDPSGMLRVPLSLREELQKYSAAAFLPAMAGGPVEVTLPENVLIVIGTDDPDRQVLALSDGSRISRAEVMALTLLSLVSESWVAPEPAETEPEAATAPGDREGEEIPEEKGTPAVAGNPAGTARMEVPEEGWLWLAGMASVFLLWWSMRLHGENGADKSASDHRDA